MSIANWFVRKEARKLAAKVTKGEEAIDEVVDRVLIRLVKKLSNWVVGINWGHIAGWLARKLVGLLK